MQLYSSLGDVGTPLMFLGCGHLLFLNAVIGLGEGSLLAKCGGVSRDRACAHMIPANYLSAWVGVGLVSLGHWWIEHHPFREPPLYTAEWVLVGLLLLVFAMTVIIEGPFVLSALRGSTRSMRWRLGATVWVQAASYIPLVLMYLAISPMSVLTDCKRTRDLTTFAPDLRAWVYYVDERDGSVWRSRVRGGTQERVATITLNSPRFEWGDGLWLRTADEDHVDLMFRSASVDLEVLKNIQGRRGDPTENQGSDQPWSIWAVDFRAPKSRERFYEGGPFAEEGLWCREWYTNQSERWTRTVSHTTFATPIWQWPARFPTMLPAGQVVFEMGGQVLIMDDERRIGAIAMGRSPVVVMESDPPKN